MSDDNSFGNGCFVGIVITMIIAWMILALNDSWWKKEAAKKGYACYDVNTGVWQWK